MPINPGSDNPIADYMSEYQKREYTGQHCLLESACHKFLVEARTEPAYGRYDYSGYCSIACRETYFSSLGAGDTTKTMNKIQDIVDRTRSHP